MTWNADEGQKFGAVEERTIGLKERIDRIEQRVSGRSTAQLLAMSAVVSAVIAGMAVVASALIAG